MIHHLLILNLIIFLTVLCLLPLIMLITGNYFDRCIHTHFNTPPQHFIPDKLQRHLKYAFFIFDLSSNIHPKAQILFPGFRFIDHARTTDIVLCSLLMTLSFILFGFILLYGALSLLLWLLHILFFYWNLELNL